MVVTHTLLTLLLLAPPPAPSENPFSEEKRVLGKILFWEEQLSSDDDVACGTCHRPTEATTDPRVAVHPGFDRLFGGADDVLGSPGVPRLDGGGFPIDDPLFGFDVQVTDRSSPSILASGYAAELFWDGRAGDAFADPLDGTTIIETGGALERQSLEPILSAVEMAREGRSWTDVTDKLAVVTPLGLATDLPADAASAIQRAPTYGDLFAAAFGDEAITPVRIAFAIATYERSLVPDATPWDGFIAGKTEALTPSQQEGWEFFEKSLCAVCHVPPLFTDHSFRNIGMRPPEEDPGRQLVTGLLSDRGKFKVPTLRNVGDRPRLMHSGRIGNVLEAVDFYRLAPGVEHFVDAQDPLVVGGVPMPPDKVAPLVDFLVNGLRDERLTQGRFPFDRPTLRSEGAVGVPVSSASRPLAVTVPTPFRGSTTFTLRNGAASVVDLFAVDGRRVRRVDLAGAQTWTWDGRDGGGRSLPAGVYFYRFESTAGRAEGRLVRLP